MIRNTDGTERLYLSKGVKEDQSIYIENCKIPQHHIDGIRFLYRQYKKKKSGVIITDTSGYGRNLQIVLFLKAVRHLFDKPVLVLCHEGTEHDWVEQFQTWTNLCDDVVLETEKPSIKKLVLINTMSKLEAFSGREWSVLVMDGDRCSQQVLRLPFKADYKIWVTPVNMKENLEKFSQIYKWLYPKEKFDKSQFTPDNSDPLDVVDKAVLLDAFMEDIVAKSEQQDTSRDTENNKKDESPTPMKISRKNKDATGTKIKRSKRKIYDDEDDAPLSKAKKGTTDGPAPPNEPKSTTVSNEDYENAMSTKYDTTDDFSIANFKRKSIEEFDEDLLGQKEESNTATSQVELYYEPDTATENNSDRLYEMNTLVFDNNTCNDQSSNDNNKDTEQNRESKENYSDDDKTQSENDFVTENNTPIKMSNNSKENEQNLNETKNGNADTDNNRGSPSIFEMKIENSDDDEESKLNIDEMESDINDIKSDICELEASKELNSVRNAINSKDNDINNTKDTSLANELTADNDKNVILNEVQNKLNENEAINENNSVTNDVVAPVTKSTKQNCIEDKMKEMEEKAMKKFKGSILDNLF